MGLMYRGCLFCKSGKEEEVVQRFEMALPGSKAIFPTRTRIRRKGDVVTEETVALLPGYVFFEVDAQSEPAQGSDRIDGAQAQPPEKDPIEATLQDLVRADSILRLLRYSDGRWQLIGSDDQFAKMLFDAGGNIGVSQAFFDRGNRIRILNGFLKDYEGSISRVNRKRRTAEVRVDLQGKKVSMWLGYELIEAVEGEKK